MRARGEGSISKHKDGRWMARFYITCPDGTKKRQHIYRKTKNEALAAMREELRLAAFGSPVVHDGRKVGEYLDYWLQHIAPNKIRKSTLIGYEATVRNHIKPAIGNKTLVGLSPEDVQIMINRHMKNGGSARLAQIIRNVLSAALHAAVNRQILHRNVARLVDVPQDVHKERGFWSPEECGKFLEHIKKHPFYPIFEMYFTFGMRRGELCGLEWRDIDFDGQMLHIVRTSQYIGNKTMHTKEPKTKSGIRDFSLSTSACNLLRDYQTWQNEQKDKLGDRWTENDRLFTTWDGKPIHPDTITDWFGKFIKRSGLPHVTLHSLRHTNATLMIAEGTDICTVSRRLGHANTSITLNIYSHALRSKDTEAADKLESALSFAG